MNDRPHDPCASCGHVHEHMAAIYSGNDLIVLCHEDDHSCYETWEDPARFEQILARALRIPED